MRTALAVKAKSQIARPLPVLVPLIQGELSAGNRAGIEHYRRAGDMLLEARELVAAFKWGKWLSKNFELSKMTASRYMRLATVIEQRGGHIGAVTTIEEALGEQPRRERHAAWRPLQDATKSVDVDEFKEERQGRADEVQLHRDLALELIDLGFKALATRLHPDRGGSKDAMRRLNRVRDELKSVAASRRFE